MYLFLFQKNATFAYKKLSEIPGITPVMPQGAMYLMVFDNFAKKIIIMFSPTKIESFNFSFRLE